MRLILRLHPRDVIGATDRGSYRFFGVDSCGADGGLRDHCRGHALDANTAQTAATEVLRKTLHTLARRMLEDGLSKVYKADSRHWSMSFRLTQVEDQWTVTYLDFGQWDAVPGKYGFGAILPELLPAMKTRKKSYELSIEQDGRVYADRGNQLELRP